MRFSLFRSLSVISCLLAVAGSTAFSQTPEPKVRSVIFYTIKTDHVADFLAAAKERSALLKKAGSERYFTLWSSQSGNREYALVRNHQKWAELDPSADPKVKEVAAQNATLVSRVMNCVESMRRVIFSLEGDLSIPMGNLEPPSMVRVIRTWVRPEHSDAYRALVKSDLLPAARKAGMKLYSVARVRYGGSPYAYESASAVANWAEMDGPAPLVAAMGDANYQKFLAKQRPMVSRQEYEMYRLMKDQSYTPAPK